MSFENIRVTHWMNKMYLTIDYQALISEALDLIMQVELSELPIVKDNKVIGVFNFKYYLFALNNEDISKADQVTNWMTRTYSFTSDKNYMTQIETTPTYILDEAGELIGIVDKTSQINFYQSYYNKNKDLKRLIKWYELSFEEAYEGLAVVDKNGIIQVFNEAYSRYVGVSKEEAIGKYAEDVIENSRLPIVLKTGIPERSQAHKLKGQNLIVHRIPLWKNNEVIGAIGMLVYEGISEIYQSIEQMEHLEGAFKQEKTLLIPGKKTNKKQVRFEDILGNSQAISIPKQLAIKASKTKATVLITGDSGVGKEQFARAIHDSYLTKNENFISVNCAAIPKDIIEAELFGYEEGSFTGAKQGGSVGKFEQAEGGTLFLDEISEMPLNVQAKILRALQEREVVKVGGRVTIPINIRVIAATNRDLSKLVKAGKFREDLYYRLNVIPLKIPSLKERKDDIPLIIAYRLKELAKTHQIQEKTIDEKIIREFYLYDWPGNIRELFNILERLYVLTSGDHITYEDYLNLVNLKINKQNQLKSNELAFLDEDNKRVHEINLIKEAISAAKGNKTEAAKRLNISRATLYNKLNRYDLN
ncbi:MAG TPA: sigma 54-interacting transcriptional regulator [Pseudogracilibacillus sp.]|nr:sigma 54-interacting transcriptional regulator [Pseudogracilibacillus sp.]